MQSLRASFGPHGSREYIQVLRLLEDFPENQVTATVEVAVKRRLIGFDAVSGLARKLYPGEQLQDAGSSEPAAVRLRPAPKEERVMIADDDKISFGAGRPLRISSPPPNSLPVAAAGYLPTAPPSPTPQHRAWGKHLTSRPNCRVFVCY